MKLKYKIKVSNVPLKINNEICVRVYMSLKKDNRDLKKHALCMSVFMKDITVDTQL